MSVTTSGQAAAFSTIVETLTGPKASMTLSPADTTLITVEVHLDRLKLARRTETGNEWARAEAVC